MPSSCKTCPDIARHDGDDKRYYEDELRSDDDESLNNEWRSMSVGL